MHWWRVFGRQCVMGDLSMACWRSMLSHPGRPSLYAVFSPLSSVVTHSPVSDSCPVPQVANLPTPPPRASSPSGSDVDVTIEEYAAHGGAPFPRTVTNSRVIILFSFAVPADPCTSHCGSAVVRKELLIESVVPTKPVFVAITTERV